MCKCLQYCLESCYWHFIEKRFCYDESIALYEVPEKEEKNNNCFDNLAFYDSVSVIAGRAIVTIEPLPEEKPIMKQPTRRLRFQADEIDSSNYFTPKIIPKIIEEVDEGKEQNIINKDEEEETSKMVEIIVETDNVEVSHTPVENIEKPKMVTLKPENLEIEVESRRRSLRERRLSKSLYLKIEQRQELPLIRQQSMPKFYLDTPDDQAHTSMFRSPSTALTSPVPKSAFNYDLHSVVQMERERRKNREFAPVHRKESDRARIQQIRDKIKLRRVKSSLGTPISNLPHSHQHI